MMNAIKERIFGAVTVIDNVAALKVWDFIARELSYSAEETAWDAIPDAAPDAVDLQMLKEIDSDPDCREFVPADEARKILGLA